MSSSIIYYPNSSNIAIISWNDGVTNSLGVQFTNSAIYHSKSSVPKSVIVEWIPAESAGKFFHERVKGVYELEKVQDG